MNNKKIITLMLTIPLLTLTFISIVQFTIAEPQARLAWSHESEGFSVEVYAPSQAYPGNVVPINVKVNATADLLDVYVILEIFGSKYENCTHWNATSFNVLWNEDLYTGEGKTEKYDLEVPLDADPGIVYGYIICKWMTLDLQDHSKYDSFSLTYLKNKDFEELQNEYGELQGKYEELNESYIKLKSKHDEIGSTRNLMYIFIVTTIVSAATAFILLISRPKRPWT